MIRLMDRIIGRLQESLQRETDAALERGMHFPGGWDPYFRDFMTLRTSTTTPPSTTSTIADSSRWPACEA